MDIPLEIAWHNTERSEALEARIRDRVEKMHRYFSHIISCRVAIEVPHRSQHNAQEFHIRIDTAVPGDDLIVSHDPGDRKSHFDPYIAVRDAFDAMDRQLENFSQKVRGDVKTLDGPPQGRVLRKFPEYGFIETSDGQEIFFSHTAVVDGKFEDLDVGAPVELSLAEGEGAMGVQASMVRAITNMRMEKEPPSRV